MLATEAALRTEGSLGGLVILSGSLVREKDWLGHLQTMRVGKPGWPVFMSHGQSDPILPFRIAEALRDHLQAANLAVNWLPFRGGHEIPEVVLVRLQAFLAAGLAAGH
jgi:phospholipase/carboxylesterase